MPKPTTNQAKELAHLSSDCSFLLTHLIRENSNSSQVLQSILVIDGSAKPTLIGKKTGWFSTCDKAKLYKPNTTSQFISPTQINGVCFTESTLSGLKAHRSIFKASHGLAFDRDFLFDQGANPCLNIRGQILKSEIGSSDYYDHLYNYIPDALAGYINIINESFDATHEREWRFLGNFEFDYASIKFIFCPQNEFSIFSKTQKNGLPVLFDLAWLDRI